MSRAGEFQELRPLLFAIAYRILGSVAEAEDAVQESWLSNWQVPAVGARRRGCGPVCAVLPTDRWC